MHDSVQKYKDIISAIDRKIEEQKLNITPKVIAVSKTFKLEKILPLIEYGHLDYGENKVQEAVEKWTDIKQKNPKIKLFIQVNIGDEQQKSGVNINQIKDLIDFSKKLDLNVIGLMCIPPVNEKPEKYFKEIKLLNKEFNLDEISMGMSSDYLKAVENSSTYLRIGSSIFGNRV